MRRRSAEPDDLELWRRVARDVVPLPGRPAVSRDRGRPSRSDAGETPAVQAPRLAPPQPVPPLDRFPGIDRANAERLKRGQRAIEARLDLHGMTQNEAHRALSTFVAGSRAVGRRCLLIITGRGRATGGILREAVPRWLHDAGLRHHVLAIAPAQPRHGGAGALYLLLRRPPLSGG